MCTQDVNTNKGCCIHPDKYLGIFILLTQMTSILLTQVQEIRSGFILEFTLMSGFGTMAIWRNVIWDYSLIPINKY